MDNTPLDTDLVGNSPQRADQPDCEKEADEFAVETLVPPLALPDFIGRVRPLYSNISVTGFARSLGVHPGIVVGQLQDRGEIGYSYHREMLIKVPDIITQSAPTDGWGYALPARV